ncbi:MAG: PHP domain-containing protein [Lachnospiraceae bacterium]|nr:PHP domain-containing protein [Lachnospiraceae bacterium]
MIDLHMHTSASDGSDSVGELLTNLQKASIDTFAVTDHDTIDGAVEMETALAKEASANFPVDSIAKARTASGTVSGGTAEARGSADAAVGRSDIRPDSGSGGAAIPQSAMNLHDIRYVKGVEFSCLTPLGKCHLLGYRYDAGDPELLAALKEGADLRRAKLEDRLVYLQKTYQVTFTEEELAWLHSQKSPGKPHIADLLLKRGIGENRNDVIQNYIRGTKKSADRISAQTAISGILHAGGIPVWAHPLGGEGEKLLSEAQFESQLLYLIGCGIKGLECHYSRYNEEQVTFLRAQAQKHGLLISGGSDYHGSRKTIALGTLNAYGAPVYEEQLTILRQLW